MTYWSGNFRIDRLNPDDVNNCNDLGLNLLHVASLKGSVEKVMESLMYINVNSRAKFRNLTALHFAAFKGHVQIVKLLLAVGANVYVKSSCCMTPLHLAHCHLIAKELVDNGAHVNVVNSEGSTPLHFAAAAGNLNLVRFLKSVGSDIDYKHKRFGYTALGYATYHGHINTVKLLLTSGADINNCGWNLPKEMINCKKYQMLRSIIEYKQQRLESASFSFNQFHSVEPRYRCDLFDFMIMDSNASVIDLFKSFSTLTNYLLFSNQDDPDVFRRLLDYDCDYNIRALDSYDLNYNKKYICLKHCVRLSVVKPDDRFCLDELSIRFNGTKEKVKSLELECRREIEVLKEMKIGDALFTMHDILVGNTVLAFRCVSGVGVKVIQEMDFGETPIYGGMVLCKLKRVFRRVNLINQLKNECTEPAALLNLPDVPFDVIVKFLSDDDLEMLVKVSCARVPLSCSLGDEFWNQEN